MGNPSPAGFKDVSPVWAGSSLGLPPKFAPATPGRPPDRPAGPRGLPPPPASTGGPGPPTPGRTGGAHGRQPPQAQQQVQPGADGQPGNNVVGVAGQKPPQHAPYVPPQDVDVQQVKEPRPQAQSQIQPPPLFVRHRMERIRTAAITPTITAPTVPPKDMPPESSWLSEARAVSAWIGYPPDC